MKLLEHLTDDLLSRIVTQIKKEKNQKYIEDEVINQLYIWICITVVVGRRERKVHVLFGTRNRIVLAIYNRSAFIFDDNRTPATIAG